MGLNSCFVYLSKKLQQTMAAALAMGAAAESARRSSMAREEAAKRESKAKIVRAWDVFQEKLTLEDKVRIMDVESGAAAERIKQESEKNEAAGKTREECRVIHSWVLKAAAKYLEKQSLEMLYIPRFDKYSSCIRVGDNPKRFIVETRYRSFTDYRFSVSFRIMNGESETANFEIPIYEWMKAKTEPDMAKSGDLDGVLHSLIKSWVPIVEAFESEINWDHKIVLTDNIHASDDIHPILYTLTVNSSRNNMVSTDRMVVIQSDDKVPGQYTVKVASSPVQAVTVAGMHEHIKLIYKLKGPLGSHYDLQHQRLVLMMEGGI